MTKKKISFKEDLFKEGIYTLKNLLFVINKYTQTLTDEGINLSIDDIVEIIQDYRKFELKIFKIEANKVCNTFGLNADEAGTIDFKIKNDMVSKIISHNCEPFDKFCFDIRTCFCNGHTYLADSKYLSISNNIASLNVNVESNLREYWTSYTETDKQNRILDIVYKLQNVYREFEDMNINRNNANMLLDNSNNVNLPLFYQLSK